MTNGDGLGVTALFPAERLSLVGIKLEDSDAIRMYSSDPPGGGIGYVDFTALPAGTAVVTYENDCSSPEGPRCDERLWMRPAGGFARFDSVDLQPRDVLILRALDKNGTELSRIRETVIS